MRVAVIGASGFVGTAVAEYLRKRGVETVPFVGSTGNSWNLLRQGIGPRVVDVLRPHELEQQLDGCTHIVNCLRGSDEVMLRGMKNLVDAARKKRFDRFVHLSSVAVYGDLPAPEAERESAPAQVKKGTYGWIKLQQDDILRGAAQQGLSSTILCPPNIFGAGSYFLLQLLDCLLKDEMLLLEGEEAVCVTVDVDNLAHACFLALTSGTSDGSRYFVTDDERVTWPQLIARLRAAARLSNAGPLRTCTRTELSRGSPNSLQDSWNVWRSIKHLASSDVREALRKDPVIAKLDKGVRALVAKLGSPIEERLRQAIEGPTKIARAPRDKPANLRLAAQQLRGVLHSCARAKDELGYRPLYSFDESMGTFGRWLVATRGMDDVDWELRKQLFGYA